VHPNKLSTSLSITEFVSDSNRPCVVIVVFNRMLSELEKSTTIAQIDRHEASGVLRCKIWQTNDRLRLTVKAEDARDGGCRDARVIMRAVILLM